MTSDFSSGPPAARKRRLWVLLGICTVLATLVVVLVNGNMARDTDQRSLGQAESRWGQAKVDYEDALRVYKQQLSFATSAKNRGVYLLRQTDLMVEEAGSFADDEETQAFRNFQVSVSDALESDTGVFVNQYMKDGESGGGALKMPANSPDDVDAIVAEIDKFDEASQDLKERTRHLSDFVEQVVGDGTDRFLSEGVPAFKQNVHDTAATRLAELDQADPIHVQEAQAWLKLDYRSGHLDDGIIFPLTSVVIEAAVSHLENLEVAGQAENGLEWLQSDLPKIQLSLPRVKSKQPSCVEIQNERLKAGDTFVADPSANSYWLDWVLGTTSDGEKKTEWREQTYACG